uniref:DEAD-box ATP-dependent RNA helicase 13-like n=1 Tax=Elaeis guineensis var. tenera TaxID=51953 RepID=A0A8N4I8M7_ELAGV
MAEISPAPPSLSEKKKKAKRAKKEDPLQAADSRRLDSLRWNDSLPNDDPFFLLAGSNEGGFLSLEEIDESEYGFVGGVPEPLGVEKKPEGKKRKRGSGDGNSGDGGSCIVQAEDGEKRGTKKQKKKK